MNTTPSWRVTLLLASCASSVTLSLGYLFLWALGR